MDNLELNEVYKDLIISTIVDFFKGFIMFLMSIRT